jgi:hypothetical protein
MLAGRVASQLGAKGYPCKLSLPEVLDPPRPSEAGTPPPTADGAQATARPTLEPARPTECSRTDWSCQGQRLTLEMRFRFQAT